MSYMWIKTFKFFVCVIVNIIHYIKYDCTGKVLKKKPNGTEKPWAQSFGLISSGEVIIVVVYEIQFNILERNWYS